MHHPRLQYGSIDHPSNPNKSEMIFKLLQNRPWGPPGEVQNLFGPPGVSRKPLQSLLEGSWNALGPKKSYLERLLGAPRRVSRQVSAVLGAKSQPQRCPRGSKMTDFGVAFGTFFGQFWIDFHMRFVKFQVLSSYICLC